MRHGRYSRMHICALSPHSSMRYYYDAYMCIDAYMCMRAACIHSRMHICALSPHTTVHVSYHLMHAALLYMCPITSCMRHLSRMHIYACDMCLSHAHICISHAYVSIRQHTSAYVSIRQHTSASRMHICACERGDNANICMRDADVC
jgi:hypothetical protein